ncbi:MAG: chorismate synthase [Candidatus Brocadiae bacterium]|nr:chorismate synthase [Candidatus Brocadiia bacterium]
MVGNVFGRAFRVMTCGESYGGALLIICEGVPAGMELSENDIQPELDRRRPGQTEFDSPRQEKDQIQIVAGVQEGKTTGAPVGLLMFNVDTQMKHIDEYRSYKDVPRPGHAEITYFMKYGKWTDWVGAGRASGRETAARVAAGALAKKILAREGIEVIGYVSEIHGIASKASGLTVEQVRANIEKTPLRCPDLEAAQKMIDDTLQVKDDGDTVGGVVECRALGVPPGVGEPVFDKLSARIAYGIMSIPSVKGIEVGDGFESAKRLGTEDNDHIYFDDNKKLRFRTNHSGGILGGISNGDDIIVRCAVKPTSTVSVDQPSVNMQSMENVILSPITRRDPTICGRIVPVVEAMVRLAILDLLMVNRGYQAVARNDNPWLDHLAPRPADVWSPPQD